MLGNRIQFTEPLWNAIDSVQKRADDQFLNWVEQYSEPPGLKEFLRADRVRARARRPRPRPGQQRAKPP
jgi:hypothetical protein